MPRGAEGGALQLPGMPRQAGTTSSTLHPLRVNPVIVVSGQACLLVALSQTGFPEIWPVRACRVLLYWDCCLRLRSIGIPISQIQPVQNYNFPFKGILWGSNWEGLDVQESNTRPSWRGFVGLLGGGSDTVEGWKINSFVRSHTAYLILTAAKDTSDDASDVGEVSVSPQCQCGSTERNRKMGGAKGGRGAEGEESWAKTPMQSGLPEERMEAGRTSLGMPTLKPFSQISQHEHEHGTQSVRFNKCIPSAPQPVILARSVVVPAHYENE